KRHFRNLGKRHLVFDLDVVSDCVLDQVVFDHAFHERLVAVGISEVDAGAGAEDAIVADDPPPSWSLGGDGACLLTSVLASEGVVFDADVMGPIVCAPLGTNPKNTGYAATVDAEVFDGEVAAVFDFDGVDVRPA